MQCVGGTNFSSELIFDANSYGHTFFFKIQKLLSRIKIWNPPKLSVIENTRLQEDGRPKLQFDVGGGPVVLKYSQRVDDGQYHQIQIIRNKEKGTIIVDDNDEEVVQGKCFREAKLKVHFQTAPWPKTQDLGLKWLVIKLCDWVKINGNVP